MTDYKHIAAKWPATAQGFRPGLTEVVQDYADQHDALTLATSRLQAWQDWTARVLSPEVLAETAAISALVAETDRDPHAPYRAAVLGAFATLQAEVAAAKQAAEGLADLVRHYKAEVDLLRRTVEEDRAIIDNEHERLASLSQGSKVMFDRYRATIEEMLLASDQCDGRMQVHQAAAKVGAFIKYDLSSGDAADAVEWRHVDAKDGDA